MELGIKQNQSESLVLSSSELQKRLYKKNKGCTLLLCEKNNEPSVHVLILNVVEKMDGNKASPFAYFTYEQ